MSGYQTADDVTFAMDFSSFLDAIRSGEDFAQVVSAALGVLGGLQALAAHNPALSVVAWPVDVALIASQYKEQGYLTPAQVASITSSTAGLVGAFLLAGGVATVAGIGTPYIVAAAVAVGFLSDVAPGLVNGLVDFLSNTFEKIVTGALLEDGIDYLTDNLLPYMVSFADAFNDMCDGINDQFHDLFQRAVNWVAPRCDPLALDLDGDGIETLGQNDAVVFDHSGANRVNGTGWVKRDDGFLVLDRNDNGTIDNGGELFGIDTVMSNGQKAKSGFQALADCDANFDGKIDANDAVFANLRVWQDADEDAVTDAGELKTLAELNIESISVTAVAQTVNLGNGNVTSGSASFTRTDGTTGTTYNLDLAVNTYKRAYKDDLSIPVAYADLPTMAGTGRVRDLIQAAIRNPGLANILQAFSAGNTRAEQMALLDGLVQAWANTSDMKSSHEQAVANGDVLVYQLGVPQTYDADGAPVVVSGSSTDTSTGSGGTINIVQSYLTPEYLAWINKIGVLERFNGQHFINVSRPNNTVDFSKPLVTSSEEGTGSSGGSGSFIVFNGRIMTPTISEPQKLLLDRSYTELLDSVYGTLVMQTRLTPYLDAIELELSGSSLALDFSGIESLLEAKRSTDAVNAYADLVDLNRHAGRNLYQQGWNGMDILRSWVLDPAAAAPEVQAVLQELHVISVTGNYDAGTAYKGEFIFASTSADNINAGDGHDFIWSGDGADTVRAAEGNDVVYGYAGNDTVYGELGDDIIFAGDGNDMLYGSEGDDHLYGGAGADYLSGDSGNDLMEGGAGNDTLGGSGGDDVFVIGRGDGQDSIVNSDDFIYTVRYKADVQVSDIKVVRDSALGMKLVNVATGDSVASQYQFAEAYSASYEGAPYRNSQVDVVEFADGTRWTAADLIDLTLVTHKTAGNDVLHGFKWDETHYMGAGNDTVYGYAGSDVLYGEDGGDTLYGGEGDDTLNSGADNDYVHGENGADTLDGGAGNDQLNGGAGNDTYLFGKGDGQDTISADYDTAATKLNVLQFKTGVAPSEIVVTCSGLDLVLSIAGTTDKVTIGWFFGNNDPTNASNAIQQVKFSDGTSWDVNALKDKAFAGTAAADNINGTMAADTISGQAGADTLYGRDGNDTLNGGADNDNVNGENGADTLEGGAGNDYVSGGNGDDTLDGGAGNDTLTGGAGNDTYLFGKGDGQDTISSDYDTAVTKLNVLQFKTGVAPSEVVATRSGWDLVLSIAGTTDKVTIGYFFYNDDPANAYNAIQQVKFSDGTSWDIATIKTQAITGNDTAQTLTGYVTADVISAAGGNDYVYGKAGDDTLDGGAGADNVSGGEGNDALNGGADNDNISGENGADTLDGGAGNDTLIGGAGNDTYLFGKGDGQDTISSDYDTAVGKFNVLQVKTGVAPSEVVATRSGSDLVLSITGTTDKVTIGYFFYSDDPANAYNAIQQVKFSDGTSWDIAAIKTQAITGNDTAQTLTGYVTADVISAAGGNDYVYGRAGDDTLDGGAGADNVYGGEGNDTLNGGADNDIIYGENGADTLDGGAGNDQLTGGAGNDSYLFEHDGGADTVVDTDATAGNTDRLLFDAGTANDQLWLKHVGSSLEVSVIGTNDKVTISNWYNGASNHVERIQVSDGHYLLDSQVEQLVQAMAGMTPPPLGQTNLTTEQHQQLDSVYATTWQTA